MQWQFKREIHFGNILTIVIVILGFAFSMGHKQGTNDTNFINLTAHVSSLDQRQQQFNVELLDIQERLSNIEGRLEDGLSGSLTDPPAKKNAKTRNRSDSGSLRQPLLDPPGDSTSAMLKGIKRGTQGAQR